MISLSRFCSTPKRRQIAALGAALTATLPLIGRATAVGLIGAGAMALTAKPAHAAWGYGYHDLGNGFGILVVSSWDAMGLVTAAGAGTVAMRNQAFGKVLAGYGLRSMAWPLAVSGFVYFLYLGSRIWWCAWHSDRVIVYMRWMMPLGADPG